jgi:hypothetical protein
VILTLAWKEYREHRTIWVAMAAMSALLVVGIGQAVAPSGFAVAVPDKLLPVIITALAMAGTYGLVCGGMLYAGEREAGTLTFLDVFSGQRPALWAAKLFLGVFLVVSQALLLAALVTYLGLPQPPRWLGLALQDSEQSVVHGQWGAPPKPSALANWYWTLTVVALEAYAWGLFGSALCRRVLSAAALAAVCMAFVWFLGSFGPPLVFLLLRVILAGMAFVASAPIFCCQQWEDTGGGSSGPPPRSRPYAPRLKPLDLAPVAAELSKLKGKPGPEPEPAEVLTPGWDTGAAATDRKPGRVPPSPTPRQALLWLTFRQGTFLAAVLAAVGFALGLVLPLHGLAIWPVVSLLIGVVCGTAAFAQEQTNGFNRFLGTQRLPLGQVWAVKITFWLTAAVLAAGLTLGGAGLYVLTANLSTRPDQHFRNPIPPPVDPGGGGPPLARPDNQIFPFGPRDREFGSRARFGFGTLPAVEGVVPFFALWLVYGFSVGQVMVLVCRKSMLAVLLATVASAAAAGLWLPSLVGKGMPGWPVFVAPVLLLIASRLVMWAWAGERLMERRPLGALIGLAAGAVLWQAGNLWHRAAEVPDVGPPFDAKAFLASAPPPERNLAGQAIARAVSAWQQNMMGEDWVKAVKEAAGMPLGVVENLHGLSLMSAPRHLDACGSMLRNLRANAARLRAAGEYDAALDRLVWALALARNLRNKASFTCYMAGLRAEALVMESFELWLRELPPRPDLLRKALAGLTRLGAEEPSPVDCVKAEFLRTHSVLNDPARWMLVLPGFSGEGPARGEHDLVAVSLEMPWEAERKERIWNAVWAGLVRAAEVPPWQAARPVGGEGPGVAQKILANWVPAADGPGALTRERLGRFLEQSWLADVRFFPDVGELREGTALARCRADAARLRLALALYRIQEGKPARTLDALVPKYLPALPPDPFSGESFRYRISKGERIENAAGPDGPAAQDVAEGQGVLESAGPGLVFVVPAWPKS